MKKLVILSVLLCALAGSVFAQWYIGGYATSWWIPYRMTVLNTDGSTRGGIDSLDGKVQHTTAVQVPWGEGDISAGIYAGGSTEWIGVNLGISISGGASNLPEAFSSAKASAVVWAKPFKDIDAMSSLTVYLGTPNNDKLQGKIGSSNLISYVLNDSYRIQGFRIDYSDSQNNIFSRLNPYNWGKGNRPDENLYWPRVSAGAIVTFEPIENLFIGAFVAPEQWNLSEGSQSWGHLGNLAYPIVDPANGDSLDGKDGATIDQDFYDARKVYQKMQFAVGYNIPGIGLVRAQYIGMRNVIEAAFQLTALEDLIFDLGFKYPIEGTDKNDPFTYKKKRDYQASLAMTYESDGFNLMARVDTAFGASDSSNTTYPGQVLTRGLNMIAYLVPSFKIGEETVGLDFGLEYEQHDLRNDFRDQDGKAMDQMKMGTALWFQRNLGAGQFKIAAVARFPLPYGGSYDNGLPLYWTGGKQAFELMFPVMISVGF
jgi:hypothetical protein